MNYARCYHTEDQSRKRYREYQESRMVVYTNAIVNPRTVMVEPFNATVADCTMSRSWCAKDFAVWAHLARMDIC